MEKRDTHLKKTGSIVRVIQRAQALTRKDVRRNLGSSGYPALEKNKRLTQRTRRNATKREEKPGNHKEKGAVWCHFG